MPIWGIVALLFALGALYFLGSFYLAWRRERLEKEKNAGSRPPQG